MSLAEYIAFDCEAPGKHEFLGGEVVRMAGGSPEHNLISANVLRVIGNALETSNTDADVFGSDQRVYIRDNLVVYPDISIACGPAQFDQTDALRNPVVIIEVLSPSTEAFDRGRKFEEYQTIPSLQHFVLIDQSRAWVAHYSKGTDDRWKLVGECSSLAHTLVVTVGEAEVSVPLAAVYRRVALPA